MRELKFSMYEIHFCMDIYRFRWIYVLLNCIMNWPGNPGRLSSYARAYIPIATPILPWTWVSFSLTIIVFLISKIVPYIFDYKSRPGTTMHWQCIIPAIIFPKINCKTGSSLHTCKFSSGKFMICAYPGCICLPQSDGCPKSIIIEINKYKSINSQVHLLTPLLTSCSFYRFS